jgi:hypothetical protein
MATFPEQKLSAQRVLIDDVESGRLRPGSEVPEMPTVEERLASLEARVDAMSEVRNLITELRGDMNARFTDVNGRFIELREDMNARFTDVSGRFVELREDMNARFIDLNGRFIELRDNMNRRFADVDRHFSDLRADVNGRFAAMDQKADRHFTWMVSTQIALLLAVVGALVGAYYR